MAWATVPAWASGYKFWVKYYPTYPDNYPAFIAGMLPQGITMDQVMAWQYAENGRSQGYGWNDLNIPTAQGIATFGSPASTGTATGTTTGTGTTTTTPVTPPASDPIVQVTLPHKSGNQDTYKVTE